MKKSHQTKRGHPDPSHPLSPPEKVGWIRKFYGRGIFREIWKNRFIILRGDHLYISEKEVKDERKAQEVFDLLDYERSEELRKLKSRSKKNHSRFTLLRCRTPGNTVPNLVFLAVSPEEKESWVNALNVGIIKAKNRILDQVTVEDDCVLVHPTRDRAKIPHGRRLPTRGHLMAVASTSSSCGMLTLDLVHEEDPGSAFDDDDDFLWGWSYRDPDPRQRRTRGGRQRSGTDASKLRPSAKEPIRVKTGGSLPRSSELSWGRHGNKPLEAQRMPGAPSPHSSQPLHSPQTPQPQSRTPQPGKKKQKVQQGRNRCASMDEVLSSSRPLRSRSNQLRREESADGGRSFQDSGRSFQDSGRSFQDSGRSFQDSGRSFQDSGRSQQSQSDAPPVGQLQSLIAQKMQRAQELLEEMRLQEIQRAKGGCDSPYLRGVDSPRLHHLRGAESPRSRSSGSSPRSRSNDSPRMPRGKESSPRQRGKDSPRANRAKRSRAKTSTATAANTESAGTAKMADNPVSKIAASPVLKGGDSPRAATDSPRSRVGDSPSYLGDRDSPGHAHLSNHAPKTGKDSSSPSPSGIRTPRLKTSDSLLSNDSDPASLPRGGGDSPRGGGASKDSPKTKASDSPSSTRSDRSITEALTPPSGGGGEDLAAPVGSGEEVQRQQRAEAERLLQEAVTSWKEAQEVLEEVKELHTLQRIGHTPSPLDDMPPLTSQEGEGQPEGEGREENP